MSKDKGKGKQLDGERRAQQPPDLSAEESALWRFVTRDVLATRGKARVRAVEASAAEEARDPRRGKAEAKVEIAPRSSETVRPPSAGTKRAVAPPTEISGRAKPIRGPATAPVEIERRKARRIARGAEDIEARLDLHGMTQDEAHRALTHFIHRCQAQGLKTVLVITGKGAAGGEQPSGPASRARGVLRQNVPRWLNEPLLAALVVGYSAASVRHGGDGALYVRLRRRR